MSIDLRIKICRQDSQTPHCPLDTRNAACSVRKQLVGRGASLLLVEACAWTALTASTPWRVTMAKNGGDVALTMPAQVGFILAWVWWRILHPNAVLFVAWRHLRKTYSARCVRYIPICLPPLLV